MINLIKQIEDSLEWNIVRKKENGFFTKEVLSRTSYVGLFILTPFASSIDGLAGLVTGGASILTAGKYYSLNKTAVSFINGGTLVPTLLFVNFLKIINPHAAIHDSYCDKRFRKISYLIPASGNGFVTSFIFPKIRENARGFYSSNSIINQHVSSRFTYMVLAIVCVVTRIIDAIISVPAVICSIVTLGKIASINNLAYRSTQYLNVVGDIFYCVVKIVNPWAKIPA